MNKEHLGKNAPKDEHSTRIDSITKQEQRYEHKKLLVRVGLYIFVLGGIFSLILVNPIALHSGLSGSTSQTALSSLTLDYFFPAIRGIDMPFPDTLAATVDISQGEPGSLQDTPTPDTTVTALQKKQLELQVQQLANQPNWLELNIVPLLTAIAGLSGLGTIAWNVWQFRKNQEEQQKNQQVLEETRRKDELNAQEQQKDQFFQKTLASLGSDTSRTAAATSLLTFLRQPGYERFHRQIFDLAVTYLRFPRVNPDIAEPPDPFTQTFIRVFTESVPLVRETLEAVQPGVYNPFLDASNIRLDRGFLKNADLKNVWLREASLIGANLSEANLTEANLKRANLSEADFGEVDFSRANLKETNFSETKLKDVNFSEAELDRANLSGANLSGANPEAALSLENTNMQNVNGYDDPVKRQKCKGKGAVFEPTAPNN